MTDFHLWALMTLSAMLSGTGAGFTLSSCSRPAVFFFLTMNNYRPGEEEVGVNPFAFSAILKYTRWDTRACQQMQPALLGVPGPLAGTRRVQGEQGALRPWPSSLGGVPGSTEVSLTAGAHPEPLLTLAREQDELMANVPSRIPRRMPTLYLGYAAGLQILSSDAETAPKGGFWPRHQHLPSGSLGLTCLKSPQIQSFPCFQPSLLPPAAEKKNSSVFSTGSKQAGPLHSDPCSALCSVRCSRRVMRPITLRAHLLSTYCLPGVVCGMGLGPKTMTAHGIDQ